MNHYKYLFCLLLSSIFLTSCGGGSSDSDQTQASGGSGFVTLLAGDDDIQDFDQAIFDISSITLIGDDNGQVVLMDEMRSIDFLALETINEVLAEIEVPVGSYSKIRFQVDQIVLKELDDNLNVIREENVRVLANGKVDVIPRNGFQVGSNESVLIAIDVDLQKSIKLIQTGNGRYQFRPVIFADILSDQKPGRIVRLAGEFEAIEVDGIRLDDRFSICDTDLISDSDSVADNRHCRLVLIDDETGVLGINIDRLSAITLADISNGDNVVIYGRLELSSVTTTQQGSYGVPVNALVIGRGQFQLFEGISRSQFDEVDETLLLELAPAQGVVGDLNINTRLPLSEGAQLFLIDGSPASSTDIADGVATEVEGLLVLSSPNSIEALIAILESTDLVTVITGMPTGINIIARTFELSEQSGDSFCVSLNDDTKIQQITEEGGVIESAMVELSVLGSAEVEVTGAIDPDDGCILAKTIIIMEES